MITMWTSSLNALVLGAISGLRESSISRRHRTRRNAILQPLTQEACISACENIKGSKYQPPCANSSSRRSYRQHDYVGKSWSS